MLEMKAVSLSYIREMTGVMTNTENGISTNRFSIFEIIKDKNKKQIHDADELELVVESVLGKSRDSKSPSEDFMSDCRVF
jgi:hypothetical protein